MTPTEELRALLDGRGVEHERVRCVDVVFTVWEGVSGQRFYAHDISGRKGTLYVNGWDFLTPAQAVEATLGRGECEWLPAESCHDFAGEGWQCSNCGHEEGEYGRDRYAFCPMCGCEVVER